VGKVSIVIPVYNEANTILGILDRIRCLDFGAHAMEVIVVDGDSTDGTRELLKELDDPWLRVIYEEQRGGKGAAVARGFQISTGDAVIIQDADDEYDPRDIPSIVLPIMEGRYQAVYGSRFKGQIENMTLPRRLANRFLTLCINVLYGSRLTDACTCYKALDGDLARSLQLETASFEVCLEITGRALRGGCRVYEVPIRYRARTEGVKSDWTAFPRALAAAFKYRFKPLKPQEAGQPRVLYP
jgi:glycosyltransferase involved in cell wall biosynthesis